MRTWLEAARDSNGRLVLCAGEAGIGKTRLAQELAGIALAGGTAVAWGRCVEAEGAPAFWPWRQVLRSLGVDPETVLAGDVESPEDRFRVFDDVTQAVRAAAQRSGLVVILDDVHWGDEPSLRVLRHLADQIAGTRLLVFASFRDVEPASVLPRVLPDLLRSPAVERLGLVGWGLAEVRDQLSGTTAGRSAAEASAVLDLTGGNPLFVREVARAMADGTWRPDRPPRTVLDVVTARLDRVTPQCRRLVQAAAIVGRDFSLALVARALDESVAQCLATIDEAIAYGFVDRVGVIGDYRFVHALTRQAVEASLATADRAALHRAVAEAIEGRFASDLSEHLADIARHWAELAPYGEAATARTWALRAGDDAVRRLAYGEAVRLYRAALALPAMPLADEERCRVLVALGRAAYLAGDLHGCLEAASAAADAAAAAESPELMSEAALVLEAGSDAGVNAVAKRLCEQALAGLGDSGQEALRARLLAQRSHLAFYDGEQDRVEAVSEAALGLARASGDDRALVDALHARKEACPGPAGRAERTVLASEMLALAQRTTAPVPPCGAGCGGSRCWSKEGSWRTRQTNFLCCRWPWTESVGRSALGISTAWQRASPRHRTFRRRRHPRSSGIRTNARCRAAAGTGSVLRPPMRARQPCRHLDRAIDHLATAGHQAEGAGARGFVAEARYHWPPPWSLATNPGIPTAPSPRRTTPTTWPERSACRRTSSERAHSSPTSGPGSLVP